MDVLPRAAIPKYPATGFFAFATCVVIAVLFTTDRHTESSHPKAEARLAGTLPGEGAETRSEGGLMPEAAGGMQKAAVTEARQDKKSKPEIFGERAALAVVSMGSPAVAASEKARFADDQLQLVVPIMRRTEIEVDPLLEPETLRGPEPRQRQ